MSLSPWPSGSILPLDGRVSVQSNGLIFDVWDMYTTSVVSQEVSEQGADWTFACLWDEQYAISEAIVGGGALTGSTTYYANGMEFPNNPNWIAKKISIGPLQPMGQALQQTDAPFLSAFQYAKCVCHFGVPPYLMTQQNNTGEDEVDFCVNSVPQSSQSTGFNWSDDNTPVPADMNLPITYATLKYTKQVFNRTSLNLPLIRSLLNHVNITPIFGAPAGAVLFQGGRSRRKITSKGALNWDITFQFEENNCPGMAGTTSGWNKLWKPQKGWTSFYMNAAGHPSLFANGDLNSLFL